MGAALGCPNNILSAIFTIALVYFNQNNKNTYTMYRLIIRLYIRGISKLGWSYTVVKLIISN